MQRFFSSVKTTPSLLTKIHAYNSFIIINKSGVPFSHFDEKINTLINSINQKPNSIQMILVPSLPPVVLACSDGSTSSLRDVSIMAVKHLKGVFNNDKMNTQHKIGVYANDCGNDFSFSIQAIAEGCNLALYDPKSKINERSQKETIKANTFQVELSEESHEAKKEWRTGEIFASCQNISRYLMDMPGNMMTPTIFCKEAEKLIGERKSSSIKMFIHDKEWAVKQNMGAFLGVASGSDEPLKFLEIHYKGNISDTNIDIALVGKGITFDSGGISLKPSSGMGLMKVIR